MYEGMKCVCFHRKQWHVNVIPRDEMALVL